MTTPKEYAVCVIINGLAKNKKEAKAGLKRRLCDMAGFNEDKIEIVDIWQEGEGLK